MKRWIAIITLTFYAILITYCLCDPKIILSGMSKDRGRMYLDWAFGKNWRSMTIQDGMDYWNLHHPDCTVGVNDNLKQDVEKVWRSFL